MRERDRMLMHLTLSSVATPYMSTADISKKKMANLNLHLGLSGISRALH